ncbi:CPBP family intramembrane glutamic endopeptidase [Sphingomonas sp.]|jgi:hypothetical protein|uniref:CPBP family intramembrane glutamic endopeptidase n=1 Tax=Sphingomonas sp. TaxID=28214 RepID=UPI002D7E7CA3|nr:CPBP family intramembrane glutamic endopeptidase [Sphingomonas sp.]HEU0044800.1 CPBP family intramembrane glutamic endopeptidase [Sphingomonas sp.]
MRQRLIGLTLLVIAIAIAWAVVAVGQATGADLIGGLIGQERLATDAPTVEALFNVLIFAPLIIVGMGGGLLERRNALAPGARPAAGFGLGMVVAFAGLSAAILYARLAGVLSPAPDTVLAAAPAMLLWGLGVIALQTTAEEVYFRGWLQPALAARWGAAAAIVAGALAFSALHVAGGARAPLSLLNLFLGGLMFGLLAMRGGGLAAAVGAHLTWNATEQLVWGLDPNPGIGSFGALWDQELAGAAIWGGSEQGLNGSIGMTIALLAIVIPLAVLGRWRLPPSPPPALATA